MSDDVETELVIPIDPPIEFQKGRYEELRLREPKSGERLKAEQHLRNGLNVHALTLHNIHLVAAVSGWPVPAVEQLPVSKLNQAAEYLGSFSSASPRTGES